VIAWCRSGPIPERSRKPADHFLAAFAHVWTVRGDKLASFNMHTDTAKVLEAVQS
jgi:ketosteroid isomerase-like protein